MIKSNYTGLRLLGLVIMALLLTACASQQPPQLLLAGNAPHYCLTLKKPVLVYQGPNDASSFQVTGSYSKSSTGLILTIPGTDSCLPQSVAFLRSHPFNWRFLTQPKSKVCHGIDTCLFQSNVCYLYKNVNYVPAGTHLTVTVYHAVNSQLGDIYELAIRVSDPRYAGLVLHANQVLLSSGHPLGFNKHYLKYCNYRT